MKPTIYGFVGVIFLILAVGGGLYLGLWFCFVGGITDVLHGFQVDPWNVTKIAIGILKFFASGFVGWGTFFVGMFIGNVFIQAA
jgi:hypothetical protein